MNPYIDAPTSGAVNVNNAYQLEKPKETLEEVRSDSDVQIDRQTRV